MLTRCGARQRLAGELRSQQQLLQQSQVRNLSKKSAMRHRNNVKQAVLEQHTQLASLADGATATTTATIMKKTDAPAIVSATSTRPVS